MKLEIIHQEYIIDDITYGLFLMHYIEADSYQCYEDYNLRWTLKRYDYDIDIFWKTS